MRNRRLHRQASGGADPDRGAASARISRLRLGRHRGRSARASCEVAKRKGKVRELDEPAAADASRARSASPTRAGQPTASRATATPIRIATAAGRYAVVHNGIIENAAALRAQLAERGCRLQLRHRHRGARPPDRRDGRRLAARDRRPRRAAAGRRHLWPRRHRRRASRRSSSSRATAARSCSASATRRCSFASDPAALVRTRRSVVHLDDGEIAVVRADGYETRTLDGSATIKTPSTMAVEGRGLRQGRVHTTTCARRSPSSPRRCGERSSGRLDPRFQTTHLGGIELAARDLLEVRPHQDPRLRRGVHRRRDRART